MADRAELQAILDCDNKPFIRAMGDAVKRAKTTGAQIGKSFAGIGAKLGKMSMPGFLGGAALVGGARAINQHVGAMNDMADAVNLNIETLQKFGFAFTQAGGSMETFVKSMAAINQKQQDAKDGNEQAIKDFQDLGISLEELNRLKPEEIMLRMADALKKSGSSGKVMADIADVLGSKVSLRLIPALKDGSAAFMEVANSAKIMSEESARHIDSLGDKVDAQISGWKSKLAEQFVGIQDQFNDDLQQLKDFVAGKKGGVVGPSTPGVSKEAIAQMAGDRPKPKQPDIKMKPKFRPGFWQKDLPGFTKPMGGPSPQIGPFQEGRGNTLNNWNGQFRGFPKGHFPNEGKGLQTGGLTSGGLTTGGVGGDAYGKVRRGDAARAKAAAKASAKEKDPQLGAIAHNTAALAIAWGQQGREQ